VLVALTWVLAALAYSGQIGGFPMEAPATTTPSIAGPEPASADLATDGGEPHRPVSKSSNLQVVPPLPPRAHPSHPAHPAGGKPLVRSTSDIELRRRFPPITCTVCRITYLTPGLQASSPPADWVCSVCLADSKIGTGGEIDDTDVTGRPPG
jgi:hypothetical protein